MRRLFPALVLVFVVSTLLILLFGDSGIMAYRKLDAYREALAANVADLRARHDELRAALERTRTDPSRTIVLARDLGLYRPGETVVKIEGRPPRVEGYAVGALVKMRQGTRSRNPVIKAAGVSVALLLAAWLYLSSRAARRRAHAAPGR